MSGAPVNLRPSASVAIAAAAQLLAGSVFAASGGLVLYNCMCQLALTGATGFGHGSPSLASGSVSLGAVPLFFGLMSLAAGVGVFRSREWGRRFALFVSTVPILCCAILVLLYPRWVFSRPGPYGDQYALLTVGSGIIYGIYVYTLLLLVPISAWWLAIFTRPRVISQFTRRDRGANAQPTLAEHQWFWVFVIIDSFIVLIALLVGFTRRV